MKVKVVNCSKTKVAGDWYADLIGEEFEVAYSPVIIDYFPYYIVKNWDYFWRKNKRAYLPLADILVTDESGSDFEDGYDLGKVHGRNEFEKELISEGILIADDYYDDEDEDLD